jgi:hypothetical protein
MMRNGHFPEEFRTAYAKIKISAKQTQKNIENLTKKQ